MTGDDLLHAWRVLNAGNQAAHAAGGRRVPNPYARGSDQAYWFNEGFHGRPFQTLTDHTALVAVAHATHGGRALPQPAEYRKRPLSRQPGSSSSGGLTVSCTPPDFEEGLTRLCRP